MSVTFIEPNDTPSFFNIIDNLKQATKRINGET